MKKIIMFIAAFFMTLTSNTEVLADIVPAGDAFRLHSSITGAQGSPQVGIAANGDFIVAWYGTDGAAYSIFAKKYDRYGNVLIPEFKVSAEGTLYDVSPILAVRPDGSFIISWQRQYDWDIYARIYDKDGVAGDQFQVNTDSSGNSYAPSSIALAPNGSFLISWDMRYGNQGIYARRFEENGTPIDNGFIIKAICCGAPIVAFQNDGSFVTAWHYYEEGTNIGIYAKMYDSDAVEGTEFQVNTVAAGNDVGARISMAPDDSFTVLWHKTSGTYGTYSRRFGSDGTEIDEEDNFLFASSDNFVSTAGDGSYIISYKQGNPITVRRYEKNGTAIGTPFTVSTGAIGGPVAASYDGTFIATFATGDGDGYGVYARQYVYECGL